LIERRATRSSPNKAWKLKDAEADLAEVCGGIEQHELGGASGRVEDDAAIDICIRQRSQKAHQCMQRDHFVRILYSA
jgi:hypothetical protein